MPRINYRAALGSAMGDDPANAVSDAIDRIINKAVQLLEAQDAQLASVRVLPDTLDREELADFFGDIRLPNGAGATGHFVETALGLLRRSLPPRYEVRSGNLGDWEIWDLHEGRRVATYSSMDRDIADDWARYLNEKEARGE